MILGVLKDLSRHNENFELPLDSDSHEATVNLGKTFSHFLLVFGEQYSTQHF